MDDLYNVLREGFLMRKRAEAKGAKLWNRAHTIFTLSLVYKSQLQEEFALPRAIIQFTELAGSEKSTKGLADGTYSV